jgi:hypothetical protein
VKAAPAERPSSEGWIEHHRVRSALLSEVVSANRASRVQWRPLTDPEHRIHAQSLGHAGAPPLDRCLRRANTGSLATRSGRLAARIYSGNTAGHPGSALAVARGLGAYAPLDFSRNATLPDGTSGVAFSLAFATDAGLPRLAFFTCQHRQPRGLLWQPDYQRVARTVSTTRLAPLAWREEARSAVMRLSGGPIDSIPSAASASLSIRLLEEAAMRLRSHE